MKRSIVIVGLLLCLLIHVALPVHSDVPPPQGAQDYLSIQYAHVISEGGYFWMNITNKLGNAGIGIELHPSSEFIRCFPTSNLSSYLKENESEQFLFIAPWKEGTFNIGVDSAVGGISTEKAIQHTDCLVLVVNADTIANLRGVNATALEQAIQAIQKDIDDINHNLGNRMSNIENSVSYISELSTIIYNLGREVERMQAIIYELNSTSHETEATGFTAFGAGVVTGIIIATVICILVFVMFVLGRKKESAS
jgi:hypothetical protein